MQYTDIERSKHYQTSVKGLQASLTNLKAYTRYQIRVSAYTKIGLGVASTEQHVVTYEDRESLNISDEKFDNIGAILCKIFVSEF